MCPTQELYPRRVRGLPVLGAVWERLAWALTEGKDEMPGAVAQSKSRLAATKRITVTKSQQELEV